MTELMNVSVADALDLLADGALLLDVREVSEWEFGRAPDALHIPLADVPDSLDQFEVTRRIICVCRSGARSGRAGRFLIEQGFDAVNLEGGMLAWANQGQPLVGDGDEPEVH